MKALFSYFKHYLRETFLGPLFKLIEASFELLVPIIIAQIVDQVIPNKSENHLLMMIFLLFILAFFGVLVAITAQYYSSKAAVGYTKELTEDLFTKIMRLPKEKRDELGTSSLVARLTGDTFQIQTGINQFLRLFLRAPIIVFGAIIMAFLISPPLTLYFLLMVAMLSLIIYITSRLFNPLYQKLRQITDQLVQISRQQLEGMRVIRAFNQEAAELTDIKTVNKNLKDWQMKTGVFASMISPLTYLVVNTTLILVIWQGNSQIQLGHLSQGSLIALVNYLLQILTELLKLAMLLTSLNQSFISARRITAVFDLADEDLNAALPLSKREDDKTMLIENLNFTYPSASRPALENLNISLEQGQTLGVIGGTGSGKSTLAQLLMHLYSPQSGSLTIYQKHKSPLSLKEWRSWVAYVPQKAELFKGTVRSNLTLGLRYSASDEDLWWALAIAQAADFVREKEEGLDSSVDSFGRNFSGGQRQRLTIARAVLHRSPLLILDDSTSALDYLTESRLLKAIKTELSSTSLVLISQRTKSLLTAEKILVLDKGHQVALGTHQELLKSSAIYQEIHHSQARKEQA
ncbi:ABC transporter ATP-binding protein [Streptococcus dentiloxodontae]